MRNIFFLFMFCCCRLAAHAWYDDWAEGAIACEEKNYAKAEEYFTKAVAGLEQAGDTGHPHVFVDRARLYLLLGKHQEALADLDKALSNTSISQEEKGRALLSRMMARSQAGGMEQGVLEDLQAFAQTIPNPPSLEITVDKILIRHAPNEDIFNKIVSCYLIHSGLSEEKKDVKILSSGTWVIEKACDCGCERCHEMVNNDQYCEFCGRVVDALNRATPLDATVSVEACNRLAVHFAGLCGKVCKNYASQAAYASALYNILQVSYLCIQQGGGYNKCVKSFEDSFSSLVEEKELIWD